MGKQDEIIKYLLEHKEATKEDLYKNSSYSYYLNWRKHFGVVLSRMVKNGQLEKVNHFTFKLSDKKIKGTKQEENEKQLKIF